MSDMDLKTLFLMTLLDAQQGDSPVSLECFEVK